MTAKRNPDVLRVLACALCLPACGFVLPGESGVGGDDPPATDDPHRPPAELDPGTLEEPFEGSCVPQAWVDEAQDAGPWGTPVAIQMGVSELGVDADATRVLSVLAPFEVALGVDGIVVFADASVAGGTEGTVVVVGAQLVALGGSLAPTAAGAVSVSDTYAAFTPAAVFDDGRRPDLGSAADPADIAALAAAVPIAATVSGLAVTDYVRAYVVTDVGTLPLEGPFVVSAERVYWPEASKVQADAVEARFDGGFFIGMNAVDGELRMADEPIGGLPMAILGRDAHLIVGPTRLQSVEPMLVRQALDDYGALVPADVQLRLCESETIVMAPGQTRVLEFAMRERGGLVDAAFHEFSVTDDETWESRIELDPTLPNSLLGAAEAHPETRWGQGLVSFVEAWTKAAERSRMGSSACSRSGSFAPTVTPLKQSRPRWLRIPRGPSRWKSTYSRWKSPRRTTPVRCGHLHRGWPELRSHHAGYGRRRVKLFPRRTGLNCRGRGIPSRAGRSPTGARELDLREIYDMGDPRARRPRCEQDSGRTCMARTIIDRTFDWRDCCVAISEWKSVQYDTTFHRTRRLRGRCPRRYAGTVVWRPDSGHDLERTQVPARRAIHPGTRSDRIHCAEADPPTDGFQ